MKMKPQELVANRGKIRPERQIHASAAPKAQNKTAQGNALGNALYSWAKP